MCWFEEFKYNLCTGPYSHNLLLHIPIWKLEASYFSSAVLFNHASIIIITFCYRAKFKKLVILLYYVLSDFVFPPFIIQAIRDFEIYCANNMHYVYFDFIDELSYCLFFFVLIKFYFFYYIALLNFLIHLFFKRFVGCSHFFSFYSTTSIMNNALLN